MEEIKKLINYHQQLTAAAVKTSEIILVAAQNGDLNTITTETKNRHRLFEVLNTLQTKIQICGQSMEDRELFKKEILPILDVWAQDFYNWSEKINQIDQQIIAVLAQQKEQVSQSLAVLFGQKSKFQGYNLASTKK